jgi:hypothetical protein
MGNHRFEHRAGIQATATAIFCGLVMLAGCATVPWPWVAHNGTPEKPAGSAVKTASPPKSSGDEADAESLKQVMSELQQVKALDPAAQDELATDLKQVNPGLRATLLQTLFAEAAYKRREEQREAANSKEETRPKQDRNDAAAARELPAAKASAAALPETRFELKGSAALPVPIVIDPPAGQEAPALALAPEPPVSGGITTGIPAPAESTVALAQVVATPAEPPSAAALLAATRSDLSSSAVLQTGFNAPLSGGGLDPNWQGHLTDAIHSIESESKPGSKNESDIALQARLRMLYLLAGRRDDAMRPLPAAPRATQDYWTSQIYGLSTWMDAEKTPDASRRAAETKRILSEALAQLGESAPLAVRNLTFCTEIFRFGSFEAVKSAEFVPGQKVLLYAEVDNLHIDSSAKGYHWAVKVSGQVFDSGGNRMVDYGSTTAEETFQTPRHDFFVSKLYYLPRLVPGRYSLQLTIEDALGKKVGQSSIDFTIKAQ